MRHFDENKNDIPIVNDIDLASGFETFITNISLMHAFRTVSNSIKSSVWIADEGWSTFDSENVNRIGPILQQIAVHYDHLILITHLDCVKNHIDSSLNIVRNQEYSK